MFKCNHDPVRGKQGPQLCKEPRVLICGYMVENTGRKNKIKRARRQSKVAFPAVQHKLRHPGISTLRDLKTSPGYVEGR